MPASWSSRVLTRLVQAEVCERDPHICDDLRIARMTVHYAASGEATICGPHVLASYMVLGLHPEKVWPAIEARRKALWGSGEVSVAATVPKKPPQSVKLWAEKTNAAKKFIASRGAMQVDSQRLTICVPMASPSIAAEYPNSEHSGSGKERPFFKREELQEFFEKCPSALVSHPELRTLHGMWIAAGKPFGSDIQFFKAIKHYCEGAPNGGYKSESAVRANIRRAERRGFLEVAYRDPDRGCHHIWIRPRSQDDRGLYRRVTTHRLSIPLLLKWRDHHHKVREMPTRKQPESTPPPKAPAPARREEPQRKTAEHQREAERSSRTEGRHTYRQTKAFRERIERHEKGCSGSVRAPDGSTLYVSPDCNVELYRAPMNRALALKRACEEFGWTVESAIEAIKYHGFTIEAKEERKT